MERFSELIQKIYKKAEQGSSLASIYEDVSVLQQEMQKALTANVIQETKRVAVQLPSCYMPTSIQEPFSANTLKVEEQTIEEVIKEEEPQTIFEEPTVIATPVVVDEKILAATKKLILVDDTDDEDEEITYTIKQPAPKINLEQITASQLENLVNEDDRTTLYVEAPIKDIKSAISLNEKFVFINELFMGEELMYERSLRTIQNFESLCDAKTWIQRELATKHGWKQEDENVLYFMDLVKRRFA